MSGFSIKRYERAAAAYEVLAHQLKGKVVVKLEGYTTAHYVQQDAIAITLHETDILTFYRDGRVRFDTGGWATMFTDQRMNKYCPEGLRVYSDRGKWMLFIQTGEERGEGETHRFYDGITVDLNTMQIASLDPGTAAWDAYNHEIDKKIKEYWKGYTNDLIIVDKCSIRGEREHVLYHLEHEDHMHWMFLQAYTDAQYRNPTFALDYDVQMGNDHMLMRVVGRFLKRTLYKGVTAVR